MSAGLQNYDQQKASLWSTKIICNIMDTKYEVINNVVVETLGWRTAEDDDNDDWDIAWVDNYITTDKLSKMRNHQKINHFPGMHGICKKNYLAWNLNKMLKLFPNDYNYFPKTWVLPGEYVDFKPNLNKKKVFIVKPEASCQGRGIFLIKRLKDINISERYVVQEYLTDPYLIEGLKFDLRIYVLVTSCNPLRVYLHEDGLTRLATEKYKRPKKSNFSNMCMHLTNYAINKSNPKFQFNSDPDLDNIGHKRSLKSTYDYLESQGQNIQELKSKIEDIILKTLCSVQPSLSYIYATCQPDDFTSSMCFELLGFDIIIDKKLNPILLEVNHSPSFTTDSPLDWKIKHKLIKDSLELLGLRSRERKLICENKKSDGERRGLYCGVGKEMREEKIERALEYIEMREKWERANMGGFKRLYPAENRDKYVVYLNAANKLWSEISGHFPKRKQIEVLKQPFQLKSTVKPKAKLSQNPSTQSAASLQKLASIQQDPPPDGPEDASDSTDQTSKTDKNPSTSTFAPYDLNNLEEILHDSQQALSIIKESNKKNSAKLQKPPQKTDQSQGNFLIPKAFKFSSKFSSSK